MKKNNDNLTKKSRSKKNVFERIKDWFLDKIENTKFFFKRIFDKETRENYKKNKMKLSTSDKVFNSINAVFMVLLVLLIVIPLLYLLANAFSDGAAKHAVIFIPKIVDENGNIKTGMTLDYFKYIIFEYDDGIFINSLKNTAIITVSVTLGSNILMALAAYPLSKPDCPYKKPLMIFFLITMLFSAGVLPIYLLMSSMHLTETIGGIILISLSNVFNLLLFKTTFEGIPKELEESASIDGANSFQLFFKIILPMTLPTFASCCFFTLVGCINGYSSALLFIRTNNYAKPMALIMYELLAVASSDQADQFLTTNYFSIQSAGIILSVIPILLIYPYIIKYIKTGITLGSVKG